MSVSIYYHLLLAMEKLKDTFVSPLWYEKFDVENVQTSFQSFWHTSIYIAAIYLTVVYSSRKVVTVSRAAGLGSHCKSSIFEHPPLECRVSTRFDHIWYLHVHYHLITISCPSHVHYHLLSITITMFELIVSF